MTKTAGNICVLSWLVFANLRTIPGIQRLLRDFFFFFLQSFQSRRVKVRGMAPTVGLSVPMHAANASMSGSIAQYLQQHLNQVLLHKEEHSHHSQYQFVGLEVCV